jgi:hypothetical protein
MNVLSTRRRSEDNDFKSNLGGASRMKLNELLNAINLGNLSILLFLVLSLVEIKI